MNRPCGYHRLNIINLFLVFIYLSGCATNFKRVDVPADVFILQNEVVAFQTRWDKGKVLTQVSRQTDRSFAGNLWCSVLAGPASGIH
jgi:hypothetical protein